MTVEILSRIQFAFTLTFHYIYPPLSIGLSIALIMMEGMYLKTKDPRWEKITKFWIRVFSLTFALGVATGIPLQFSLGANWSRYSRFVGDVFGSLLGAEGLFAFLVEAGFLGVLLFGWDRVSHKVHFLATILVSLGAHFSAIWIVSANSWMQYPSGYKIATDAATGEKVAQVTNWFEVFLSPTNLSHLTHVLIGAWLAGSFLIISVSAYYLLKKKHYDFAERSMKVGLIIAGAMVIAQLVSADNLGRKVAKYNPVKLAAFEGIYTTQKSTPAYAVGWVDTKNEKVYGIKIPGLMSFLVFRNFTTPVDGLEKFSRNEWPLVPVVFQIYHLMILAWGVMAVVAALGIYYWIRNRWDKHPWILRLMVISVLFPQIANLSGWYSSCMGRQPWTVYKLLKTNEAFSPNLSKGDMIASLTMFVVMYSLFFVLFLLLLDKKIKTGPVMEKEALPYRDIYKEGSAK